MILDLGGVSGKNGLRRQSTQGVTSRLGPIDVQDESFRRGPRVWEKWKTLESTLTHTSLFCAICRDALSTDVSVLLQFEPLLISVRITLTSLSAQRYQPRRLPRHVSV